MAINTLSLKHVPLDILKVGDATLIGPYESATMPASRIAKFRKDYPDADGTEFSQRQFLLVDPKTCETMKMYLLTRTK